VRDWLDQLWTDPTARFPRAVGQHGYDLPSLAGLGVLPVQQDSTIPGVTLTVADSARNNWVVLPQDGSAGCSLKLELRPNCCNNILVLAPQSQLTGTITHWGSDGLIVIAGAIPWPSFLNIRLSSNHESFFWGAGATSNGGSVVMQGDGGTIIVGEDTMLATDIMIRNSDLHGIVDMATGAWLNPPGHVLIEPHVWLGQGATILKDTTIGYGSIVGSGALVTHDVPRFSAVGGVPARILKHNVSWTRDRTPPTDSHHRIAEQAYGLPTYV